ncbi:MAG: hypothetical protein P8Y80_04155 [Acidobacteriota bacterium]|jgi:hypothetical protein
MKYKLALAFFCAAEEAVFPVNGNDSRTLPACPSFLFITNKLTVGVLNDSLDFPGS